MTERSTVNFRARYVFTAAGPPLRDAVVSLEGSRIVAVGKARGKAATIELGNAAILPGLVNAHTHLEFSDLDAPLGSPGMSLVKWIPLVVAHRRKQSDKKRQAAVSKGLAECGRFGTTSVCEIATAGWPIEAFASTADHMPEATIFLESLGVRPVAIDAALAASREHLLLSNRERPLRLGLSPHAPYSTHPELVRRLVGLSMVAGAPVAMHLAESRDELELLQTGRGAFRDLLVALKAWQPKAIPTGSRPLDYLRMLREAHRALVIHGNYLSDEEIAFVAANAQRMAVVYCPRTHAYFGHAPYPLAKMLKAGVVVALGTDSRASNPDLNLLAEMREIAARHKIAPETVVEMGTINGATALGRDAETGSIVSGKRADLAIVRLPDSKSADPYEALFDPRSFVEEAGGCGKAEGMPQ